MAKFRFPLEALLEQRSAVEKSRQLAVAALERERIELEGLIGDRQRQIRSHKDDLRALLTGVGADGTPQSVDTRTVRLQANASLHAQVGTQRMALQLAGVYRRLEAERAELMRATTARRAVETLKTRRLEAWKRELNRKESTMLDEMATMAVSRGRRPFGSEPGVE